MDHSIQWNANIAIFKERNIRGSERRPFSGASKNSFLFSRSSGYIYVSKPKKKDVFRYLFFI